MAVPFDCRFSTVGNVASSLFPTIPITIPSADGAANSLRDLFFFSSGSTIDLRANYQFLTSGYDSSLTSVPAESLHRALSSLTQNPSDSYPVPRLGVLFASDYASRDNVFGVMFDTGFIDPDAPTTAVSSSPRQGCAIFLQTIQRRRSNQADYQNQVTFDLVHELGHVFNLQHVSDADCFLNISAEDETPPKSAFSFLPTQRTILAECGIDRAYTPGGDPFGSGDLGNEDAPQNCSGNSTRLKLQISVAQEEFWPWEPIELDIHLGTGRRSAPLKVPDRVDPGYSDFKVWIEEPSGERRRYRPTKHYCAYDATLQVAPRKAYRRDISIFAESGGYTFRRPGIHRIWVTFQLSSRYHVQSNVITVLVKTRRLSDKRAQRRLNDVRRLARIAARTLYYRSGVIRSPEVAALEELIRRSREQPICASARYALGRLFYDQIHRSPSRRKHWESKAKPYLLAARDEPALSGNRRRRASQIIANVL
jgi:hypothetical protein